MKGTELHSHTPGHHHNVTVRNDYARLIAAILMLCLLAAAGFALQHTISCFLLSWIIAYLLDPVVIMLEKRGMKRVFALAAIYVVLSILFIFFLTIMVPMTRISWDAFVRDLPLYIQKIKLAAEEWKNQSPDIYGTEEIDWLLNKASGNIDTAAKKVGSTFYGFATRIFFNLFNLVLAPILVFFMLHYKKKTIETVASWIPEHRRDLVLGIGREVNTSIGGYLRGQVVVSLIVAVFSFAALFAMDIPHPLFCGLFAGAASILPFIGVILATVPALFFAWFKYQALAVIAKVCAAFAVIYFVEGYIVKPLVFKESMNLNPLVTIIMVMALGEMLGFWGILLALPIAAAIKITWRHFLNGDFRQDSHHHHHHHHPPNE